MPYRIYALAAQLDITSQQLVDLCAKLGIRGKSSAFSPLEDNEAALIADSLGKKLGPPRVTVLAGTGPTAFRKVEIELPPSMVQTLISTGKIANVGQLPDYIKTLLHQEIRGRHTRLSVGAEALVEEWVENHVNLDEYHSVDDIAEYASRCERYIRSFGYALHNAENQTSKVFIRMGLRRRDPRR